MCIEKKALKVASVALTYSKKNGFKEVNMEKQVISSYRLGCVANRVYRKKHGARLSV